MATSSSKGFSVKKCYEKCASLNLQCYNSCTYEGKIRCIDCFRSRSNCYDNCEKTIHKRQKELAKKNIDLDKLHVINA